MTTKERNRMKDQILKHGFDLLRIFHPSTMYDVGEIGPVELCRKLHRIELQAHRYAERVCNGEIDPTEAEDARWEANILGQVDRLLNFRAAGIPVFINGDPRGHALKIDDKYVRDNNLEIERDWGGYGLIAPEFDGKQ